MTLSEVEKSEIKRLRSLGRTYERIADDLGHSKSTISTVLNGTKKKGTKNSTNNSTVLKLLSFLNEIKNTFFAAPTMFVRFVEVLERHLTMDELMELEAGLQ